MKTRLALLLALLAAAACTAQNNASVKVAAICAPPDDPTACVFSSTCTGQYIGLNAVDIAVTNKLWTLIQVDNQAPDNENLATGRLNTNDAYVQEAHVEYTGAPLPTSTAPILGSAVVPAAGSSVISVLPIPESVGTYLQGIGIAAGGQLDIVAKLRLRGVYADTTKFETGVFEIPLRICNGCVGALTCTLPAFAITCPPRSAGQLPLSSACFTP
jgi:hypothetical protein